MLTETEEKLLGTFRGNSMYQLNRLRRMINVRRFRYDFLEAGLDQCENCPYWMISKLFGIGHA